MAKAYPAGSILGFHSAVISDNEYGIKAYDPPVKTMANKKPTTFKIWNFY
jgi:hypothetical protein